jgi:hypothetical protein
MPWLVEIRSLDQHHATRLRSFLRAKAFSGTRSEIRPPNLDGISKIKRIQELSYEEWPERESNPHTRIFSARTSRHNPLQVAALPGSRPVMLPCCYPRRCISAPG